MFGGPERRDSGSLEAETQIRSSRSERPLGSSHRYIIRSQAPGLFCERKK